MNPTPNLSGRFIAALVEPRHTPGSCLAPRLVGIDWTKRDPLVDPFDKLKATLGEPATR